MEQMWLPIAVRLETTQWQVRERVRDAWLHRYDDELHDYRTHQWHFL